MSRHRDAWMALLSSQTSAAAAADACRTFSRRFPSCTLDRRYCIHIQANGPTAFIYSFRAFVMIVYFDRVFGYLIQFSFIYAKLCGFFNYICLKRLAK